MRHLSDLADLGLETSVFSLLSLLSLHNHVIQNANLFLEVALDVVALGFSDIFDCVLLALELTDFFACVRHLLLEHHDLFFKSVNRSLKAKWLLGSERGIRLAHYLGTCNAHL